MRTLTTIEKMLVSISVTVESSSASSNSFSIAVLIYQLKPLIFFQCGICYLYISVLHLLLIYSVAGFEMKLSRHISHYLITYYLPSGGNKMFFFLLEFQRKLLSFSSGLFVVVSWISFVVPPEVIPGRMVKKIISGQMVQNNSWTNGKKDNSWTNRKNYSFSAQMLTAARPYKR